MIDAVEKGLRTSPNSDSGDSEDHGGGRRPMMSRWSGDQPSFIYQFRLDERVPKDHLLRRIDRFVTPALADMHERLQPYGSDGSRIRRRPPETLWNSC